MDEKEAREIVGRPLSDPLNIPLLHEAEGYLQGLKDGRKEERGKAKELVEAADKVFKHYDVMSGGLVVTPYSAPGLIMRLGKAIAEWKKEK